MSSRAFRRLNKDADVIKLPALQGEEIEEGESDSPSLQPKTKKGAGINPYQVLLGNEDEEDSLKEDDPDDEVDNDVPELVMATSNVRSPSSSSRSKKKRKKKKKQQQPLQSQPTKTPQENDQDEVDVAIKEVTEMLGGLETTGPDNITTDKTQQIRSLLCVNRRFLNADNEMKRIFGSRVVRAEQSQRRDHRKRVQRQTMFVTPRDTWPAIEKLGISMQLVEVKNNCQYFQFEHSQEYQKVQFSFLDAVETYDPNAIGSVLHAHPYHIDSLIQLSEVCKMGEDMQMAAELIERAVYQFESCFHPLFNVTQDNCRISYNRAENRSFFLALFKHLNYVERKGCHQTAFELCKLLLSLDPDSDPLCVSLMLDYHALRAYEYQFLIDYQKHMEAARNLSQLPNFALSVPLAMFLHSTESTSDSGRGNTDESGCGLLEEANKKIQEALIMFPMFLLEILDKCSATLSATIMNHTLFSRSQSYSEALQLLIKLYVARTHSLWKPSEVLEWLGSNALRVIERANNRDPLIQECSTKRQKRYVGTPRNISRHVILSDLENTTSALPRDITGTPIMMYDPLPPVDSTSGYTRPPRERGSNDPEDPSNPFSLFLRSLLPTFNATGHPQDNRPHVMGMPQHVPPDQDNHHHHDPNQPPLLPGIGGAVGGVEGGVRLENAIGQITTSLARLLEMLQPPARADDGQRNNDTSSEEDD